MRSSTASTASGPLAALEPFIAAGLFDDSELQLAKAVARLSRQASSSTEVILATAVAARGFRSGHVCVDMSKVPELLAHDLRYHDDLPWPEPKSWIDALHAATEVVSSPETVTEPPIRPLVLDGVHLYLQRHWLAETFIAQTLRSRASTSGMLGFSEARLDQALTGFFGPDSEGGVINLQRLAARTALESPISIIAGGPGTGKTRTVARLLATAQVLASQKGSRIHVATAAPSGKAAARMTEAIENAVEQLVAEKMIDDQIAAHLRSIEAQTIHRLLGSNPRRGYRHDAQNPLAYDIVVIDETSMVDLPLMAALLAAVPERCHLVLVGDPDQLASVQAGTVLSDIVRPVETAALNDATPLADPGPAVTVDPADADPGPAVTEVDTPVEPLAQSITILRHTHRFGAGSGIAVLAAAIRSGDTYQALEFMESGAEARDSDVDWIRPDEVDRITELTTALSTSAIKCVDAARSGEVTEALEHLTSVKVLAAINHQSMGVIDWTERIEAGLFAAINPETVRVPWSDWYIGRPVMITRNDPVLRVANGDVGVTLTRDDLTTVALDGNPIDRIELPAVRLDGVQTWWAMTIHKSQGSEFDHVIVSLPPAGIPILTRELLYTGVTRARSKVTVIGGEDAIRAAIDRRISRASGLQNRLWGDAG